RSTPSPLPARSPGLRPGLRAERWRHEGQLGSRDIILGLTPQAKSDRPFYEEPRPVKPDLRFFLGIHVLLSQGGLCLGSLMVESPLPRALPRPPFIGVPVGLVGSSFYCGSSAAPARPDDGLGTWRLILRVWGPLPARMGRPKLATRIHSTF